jgi:hypothetical protein
MDVKNVQEKTTAVVRSQSVIDSIEEMFKSFKKAKHLTFNERLILSQFLDFIKNS